MPKYNQNFEFNGLVDFSFPVPNAGLYRLTGKISIPHISAGDGPSSVVCVIKVNASTIRTYPAGCDGFNEELTCAAGDVVHVVLTSAATADQGLNKIKTQVSISEGL